MKTFSIKLKEEEIQVGDQVLVMREFSGTNRDLYIEDLNARVTEVEVDGKKERRITKMAGMPTKMLSLCLFKKDGTPVTEAEIGAWPAVVVRDLHSMAMAMNDLDKSEEQAKEAAKNV